MILWFFFMSPYRVIWTNFIKVQTEIYEFSKNETSVADPLCRLGCQSDSVPSSIYTNCKFIPWACELESGSHEQRQLWLWLSHRCGLCRLSSHCHLSIEHTSKHLKFFLQRAGAGTSASCPPDSAAGTSSLCCRGQLPRRLHKWLATSSSGESTRCPMGCACGMATTAH